MPSLPLMNGSNPSFANPSCSAMPPSDLLAAAALRDAHF